MVDALDARHRPDATHESTDLVYSDHTGKHDIAVEAANINELRITHEQTQAGSDPLLQHVIGHIRGRDFGQERHPRSTQTVPCIAQNHFAVAYQLMTSMSEPIANQRTSARARDRIENVHDPGASSGSDQAIQR